MSEYFIMDNVKTYHALHTGLSIVISWRVSIHAHGEIKTKNEATIYEAKVDKSDNLKIILQRLQCALVCNIFNQCGVLDGDITG